MDWLTLADLFDLVIDRLELMFKHGLFTLIGTFGISLIPVTIFRRLGGRGYLRRSLKTTLHISSFFAAITAIVVFTFLPDEDSVYFAEFTWFLLIMLLEWPIALVTFVVNDSGRFIKWIRKIESA